MLSVSGLCVRRQGINWQGFGRKLYVLSRATLREAWQFQIEHVMNDWRELIAAEWSPDVNISRFLEDPKSLQFDSRSEGHRTKNADTFHDTATISDSPGDGTELKTRFLPTSVCSWYRRV
jgi:hypothetical protein